MVIKNIYFRKTRKDDHNTESAIFKLDLVPSETDFFYVGEKLKVAAIN